MSEEHRFRCETRHVLKLGPQANRYLNMVADKRGKAEADRLRLAAREQWQMGNKTGEWGRWETKMEEAA